MTTKQMKWDCNNVGLAAASDLRSNGIWNWLVKHENDVNEMRQQWPGFEIGQSNMKMRSMKWDSNDMDLKLASQTSKRSQWNETAMKGVEID